MSKGTAPGVARGEAPAGGQGKQPLSEAQRQSLLRPFELDINITQEDELRGAAPFYFHADLPLFPKRQFPPMPVCCVHKFLIHFLAVQPLSCIPSIKANMNRLEDEL